MRTLRDKHALVTGAASGIGRAIALRLAQEGARLYLLDIDEPRLAGVVREARGLGVDAVGRRCDVSERAQIDASIDAILERWGHLDLLVNNAGVAYYGPTYHMTTEQWDRLLAVNLLAPVHFVQRLLPSLMGRPEAHIVNVASICGLVGVGRLTAYSTTKFGLVGLSEALRAELRRRYVGVTAVCPGLVDTQLMESTEYGRKAPRMPQWLFTTPERIADKTVRAIHRNRPLVMATPLAYLLHYAKRFAPGLLDLVPRLGRRQKRERNTVLSLDRPIRSPDRPTVSPVGPFRVVGSDDDRVPIRRAA